MLTKILKPELFRKRCSHDCHVVSLIKFSISDCCIFKLLLYSADGTAVSAIYFTELSKRLFLLNRKDTAIVQRRTVVMS